MLPENSVLAVRWTTQVVVEREMVQEWWFAVNSVKLFRKSSA